METLTDLGENSKRKSFFWDNYIYFLIIFISYTKLLYLKRNGDDWYFVFVKLNFSVKYFLWPLLTGPYSFDGNLRLFHQNLLNKNFFVKNLMEAPGFFLRFTNFCKTFILKILSRASWIKSRLQLMLFERKFHRHYLLLLQKSM